MAEIAIIADFDFDKNVGRRILAIAFHNVAGIGYGEAIEYLINEVGKNYVNLSGIWFLKSNVRVCEVLPRKKQRRYKKSK